MVAAAVGSWTSNPSPASSRGIGTHEQHPAVAEPDVSDLRDHRHATQQDDFTTSIMARLADGIEADRDVHIDKAKAMGSALSGAQIRMYGGGDGTMDTIRGLFTQGFGIGEVLEGLAQSLPEGLRQRFNANGIRGLLGRPYDGSSLKQTYEHLNALVQEHLKSNARR
jgi:hypothetical protein